MIEVMKEEVVKETGLDLVPDQDPEIENLPILQEREEMTPKIQKKLLESATNAETTILNRIWIGNVSKENANYGITQWSISPKKLGKIPKMEKH